MSSLSGWLARELRVDVAQRVPEGRRPLLGKTQELNGLSSWAPNKVAFIESTSCSSGHEDGSSGRAAHGLWTRMRSCFSRFHGKMLLAARSSLPATPG